MRKFCIIAGIVTIIVGFMAILPIKERINRTKAQWMDMNAENLNMQQRMEKLQMIKDQPLKNVTRYFQEFMGAFRDDISTYAFQAKVSIDNANGKDNAQFVGVKRVGVNGAFYHVDSTDEVQRILDVVESWVQRYPFKLESIVYKEDQIHINGGLYGL